MSVPNVIVYGESGAGKSSVINMLEGGKLASVSDQAIGVTFSSAAYEKTISGLDFKIYDTVGLNEGSKGTVSAENAIEGLHGLMGQLVDGVSLLVYVMRAPRIKSTTQGNYQLFFEIFCQKKVPIVIIITGLEARDNMDGWWTENKKLFEDYGMLFSGHACITAIKGKRSPNGSYAYEEEYNESVDTVKALISTHSRAQDPWKMDSASWFDLVIEQLLSLVGIPSDLTRALQSYGGLSHEEAKVKAKAMENRIRVQHKRP